jgi:mannose-6-phosphate isomerase-like protein (cupin superfamily)
MTLLTSRGRGPSFPYAGRPLHVLAGQDGTPAGFAAAELAIPPHFAGPIPHAHDQFDEAIYVVTGRLLVLGDGDPEEAVAGSMFVAPRGQRHGFTNPDDEVALVLGLWSPAAPALAFMRDVGAALPADGPPDPDRMREIYERHASRLLP